MAPEDAIIVVIDKLEGMMEYIAFIVQTDKAGMVEVFAETDSAPICCHSIVSGYTKVINAPVRPPPAAISPVAVTVPATCKADVGYG